MKIFKNRMISDSELICRMEDLRDALKDIGRSDIIFMNLDSFYAYTTELENKGWDKRKNIEELINIIEPYIPIVITDQNIEAFLYAAINNNEENLNQMEKNFVQSSKIKFIQSVIKAKTTEQWQEIVNICRTIRAYKEEGVNIDSLLKQ